MISFQNVLKPKKLSWVGHDNTSCYANSKVGAYGIYWGGETNDLIVTRGYLTLGTVDPCSDAPYLSHEYLANAYAVAQQDHDERVMVLLNEIAEPINHEGNENE